MLRGVECTAVTTFPPAARCSESTLRSNVLTTFIPPSNLYTHLLLSSDRAQRLYQQPRCRSASGRTTTISRAPASVALGRIITPAQVGHRIFGFNSRIGVWSTVFHSRRTQGRDDGDSPCPGLTPPLSRLWSDWYEHQLVWWLNTLWWQFTRVDWFWIRRYVYSELSETMVVRLPWLVLFERFEDATNINCCFGEGTPRPYFTTCLPSSILSSGNQTRRTGWALFARCISRIPSIETFSTNTELTHTFPIGTGFGSTPSGTSAFGTQNRPAFGAPAASTSGGGLFGGGTATVGTTGGFGGFGSNTTNNASGGGLFGQPAAQKPAFGNSATGGGLFGGAGGGFGQPNNQAAGSFGGLGGNVPDSQGTGSTPFQAYSEKEGTGNATNHFQSISTMEPYKKYSYEVSTPQQQERIIY